MKVIAFTVFSYSNINVATEYLEFKVVVVVVLILVFNPLLQCFQQIEYYLFWNLHFIVKFKDLILPSKLA